MTMNVNTEQLKRILEGAIMAAGEPLTVEKLQTLFEESEMPEKNLVREALESVQNDCEGRGYQLVEVASGWRFVVREDLATWVNRLWEEKPQKYSRALLETLALIAYRQPLTRGDIEEVRGVAVSSHIIKTLSEREWVKVVGHRDVPGRPSLYATTKKFLDYFNLKSLEDLPTLGELKDIDSLNKALDFEGQPPVDEKELAEITGDHEEELVGRDLSAQEPSELAEGESAESLSTEVSEEEGEVDSSIEEELEAVVEDPVEASHEVVSASPEEVSEAESIEMDLEGDVDIEQEQDAEQPTINEPDSKGDEITDEK